MMKDKVGILKSDGGTAKKWWRCSKKVVEVQQKSGGGAAKKWWRYSKTMYLTDNNTILWPYLAS
jgi:hypothetical protein